MPVHFGVGTNDDRNWKPLVFLGATLVPAFFAGVFALIPNLFDRFTSPESKITFSTISSPAIKTGTQFSKIFSVSLTNEGSVKLTNVDATVALQVGNIETASLDQSAGDRPTISKLDGGVRLTVRSMFPNERVGITVLVSAQTPNTAPAVSVRSDQVLGEKAAVPFQNGSDLPKWFFLFPALGAALAAPIAVLTKKGLGARYLGSIATMQSLS